jgi:hypothetical protein
MYLLSSDGEANPGNGYYKVFIFENGPEETEIVTPYSISMASQEQVCVSI